jgi:hypothetical protein
VNMVLNFTGKIKIFSFGAEFQKILSIISNRFKLGSNDVKENKFIINKMTFFIFELTENYFKEIILIDVESY